MIESSTHIPMSGQAGSPSAALRRAFIPQVGASTQATGSTQLGSSASGIRKPQIVQTGNSNRLPTIQAARKRTKAEPIRKPSIPIERIVGGTATMNAGQSATDTGTPKRKRT